MSAVERGDRRDPETFGDRDHGGIDGPERELAVSPHELGDPQPIGRRDGLRDESSGCEILESANLNPRSQAGFGQVGDLSDDELRNEQRTRMSLEELQ